MAKLLGPHAVTKTYATTEEVSRESIANLMNEGGDVYQQLKLYVSPDVSTR